jgi:RHS repeat-associated protein
MFMGVAYSIAATLDWDNNADLDLYASHNGEVVWFLNFQAENLQLNDDAHPECDPSPGPPEIISSVVDFTQQGVFRFWYNRFSTCSSEPSSITTTIVVENTGDEDILVNGARIAPTENKEIDGIYRVPEMWAQNEFGGGTIVVVSLTPVVVPQEPVPPPDADGVDGEDDPNVGDRRKERDAEMERRKRAVKQRARERARKRRQRLFNRRRGPVFQMPFPFFGFGFAPQFFVLPPIWCSCGTGGGGGGAGSASGAATGPAGVGSGADQGGGGGPVAGDNQQDGAGPSGPASTLDALGLRAGYFFDPNSLSAVLENLWNIADLFGGKCDKQGGGGGASSNSFGGGTGGNGGGVSFDRGGSNSSCICSLSYSSFPIRYSNGEIQYAADDIELGGNGYGWGHTRVYSNQLTNNYDYGNGYNWIVSQWAYMKQQDDDSMVIVWDSQKSVWFDYDDVEDEYVARFGSQYKLRHDGNAFVATSPTGDTWEFRDFTQTDFPQGAFKSHVDPGGERVNAISYNGPNISEIQRTFQDGAAEIIESYLYEYQTLLDDISRLESVTFRYIEVGGATTNVSQAGYTYYDGTTDDGSQGDLETVTFRTANGTGWIDTDHTYYRYFKSGATEGFEHGLKYVLGPGSYAEMALVQDPLTATDNQLAEYADHYFEYDGDRRAVREVVAGGEIEFSYTYTDNTADDDPNNWQRKTVEDRPDGGVNIVYTNYLGRVLLTDYRTSDSPSADRWVNYFVYDENFQLAQWVKPSAIISYVDDGGEEDNELVVTVEENSSLIHVREYYPIDAEFETCGAAPGRLKFIGMKQGEMGDVIKLREYKYMNHIVGDQVVFPLCRLIDYTTETDQESNKIETAFEYEWHLDDNEDPTFAVKQRTTTLPVIPTAQNGTDEPFTRTEIFTLRGKPIWERGPRGFIDHLEYDEVTGAISQYIRDVDDAKITVPDGWSTPTGGGLHLVFDAESDSLGRYTQLLGPPHDVGGTMVRSALWVVDNKVIYENWLGTGYSTGTAPNYNDTYDLVGGVVINRFDDEEGNSERIVSQRTTGSGRLSPTDTFDQADWLRRSAAHYGQYGRMEYTREYHEIPSSGSGSPVTNYDDSLYGYDGAGRLNKWVTPAGTITITVLNARGLLESMWVGTDDGEISNDMRVIEEREYDNGVEGLDNLLTKVTRHVDATTTRVTDYEYDWRNRVVVQEGPLNLYSKQSYDNLGRVVREEEYNGSDDPADLQSRQDTFYDNRSRVYRTVSYAVNLSTGSVVGTLTDNAWYDAGGNLIKQQAGGSIPFVKFVYDSVSRPVKSYIGLPGEEEEPDSVEGDFIFEQSAAVFDQAANLLQITSLSRYHDDTTSTGELIAPPDMGANARPSYVAFWYDELGRTIAVADYGTNNDASFTRPVTAPAASDTIIVDVVEYDAMSQVVLLTDAQDRQTKLNYDDLGRVLEQIANYVESGSGADENITNQASYDAGRLASVTMVNAATGNQVTSYVYGTTLSNSDLATEDLPREVVFPGGVKKVSSKYNRLTEITETTDRNGTVHRYTFDALGRLTTDEIVSFAAGVDPTVQKIGFDYRDDGQIDAITSYGAADAVLNQVAYEYDAIGLPIRDYQEHAGAKHGGTPYTGYEYDLTQSADEYVKGLRPTGMRYPGGTEVAFSYGSSASFADRLSRVAAVLDGSSNTLAAYADLGLGTLVTEDFADPEVRLNYAGSSAGSYPGFDRLDRVQRQLWRAYTGGGADRELLEYGFDRDSNPLYRLNQIDTDQSELYALDGLDRLVSFKRGELSNNNTEITNPDWQEDSTLDPADNWQAYDVTESGSILLAQTRGHNALNEITAIAQGGGQPAWVEPEYDANGNMTAGPGVQNPTERHEFVYDAWDRLSRVVKGSDGGELQAVYDYDGLHSRIHQTTPSGWLEWELEDWKRMTLEDWLTFPLSGDRAWEYYYNDSWQLLESRRSSGGAPQRDQRYAWSLRYLDAPIFRDTTEYPGGVPTAGDRLYYLTDPKMNVTCLVDDSGTAVERYLYDPYGTPLYFDGGYDSRSASAYENEILFSGYRQDPATGLYHVRFRDYHPRLGRWLNTDPLGYDDGPNLYGYAAGNPTAHLDPYGLAVRAPGFWEGLIPVWGSGLQSAHYFSCGRWGWGLLYAGIAVSDVFLVRSLATGAVKGAWKFGSHTWGATSKWFNTRRLFGIARGNWPRSLRNIVRESWFTTWREFPGQEFHHWLVRQEWYQPGSRLANWFGHERLAAIFNQPWNLVRVPSLRGYSSKQLHSAFHGAHIEGLNLSHFERLRYGAPVWFQSVGTSYSGRTVGGIVAP